MKRLVRRLRAPRPDRGYTLVEMMIATALLSLVTTAAFGVVIVMQNQAVATTDRFTATGEGWTIADRITKDLRTAVAPTSTTAAFASAGANDVVFYANLADLNTGNGPTRLHAYTSLLPGSNVSVFHEDATKPDVGGTPGNYTYSGAAVNRLDGQYIDTTQPIFSYYDADGTQILPMPITGNANLRSIDAVGVTLRIRVHPRSPVVVISTRIHVRNVDYNPDS
jgi:prepilin-type N-terminal cleavage/methylation domain-containing protein